MTMVVGFRIPDVHLAPGFKFDLISVRELTRNRICTFFDGDQAMLSEGPGLIGAAVAPQEEKYGLYVLKFLSVTGRYEIHVKNKSCHKTNIYHT